MSARQHVIKIGEERLVIQLGVPEGIGFVGSLGFESVDKFIHYVILCFWLFFTGVMDVGVQEMWR